jgi:hypothetical protein
MNITGRKIIKAELSGHPGKVTATLIELDGDVVFGFWNFGFWT